MVLLSNKNITLKGAQSRKLLSKWSGPYRIKDLVGPVAARLELPNTARIHDVFHVSLLKNYRSDGRVYPPPSAFILKARKSTRWNRSLLIGPRARATRLRLSFSSSGKVMPLSMILGSLRLMCSMLPRS